MPDPKPSPATPGNLAVTPGARVCTPFILQVGVYNPESGYRFNVSVELSCSTDNRESWKLVFDLYKSKSDNTGFDQLVHVLFQAGPLAEQQAVQDMLNKGVTPDQADAIQGTVFSKTKALAQNPSTDAKAALHSSISQDVLGSPAAPAVVSADL